MTTQAKETSPSASKYQKFWMLFDCGPMHKPLSVEVIATDFHAALADVLAAYAGIEPHPITWGRR